MNKFRVLINFTVLITFSTSSLFANTEDAIFHKEYTAPQEENTETLEDEVPPPPIPALIDLSDRKKQRVKALKYSGLALLLFNIAMFTAGMALVKAIDGKDV